MTNKERTLLALAELFVEKRVELCVINKSLEIICNNFCFECGLIYETDQYNKFNLIAHANPFSRAIKKSFSVEEIRSETQALLTKDLIFYAHKQHASSAIDMELLALFSAEEIVISPVVDEDMCIHGHIVFINKLNIKDASEMNLQKSNIQALSVILSMLGKFISVKIYNNKLSFAKNSLENILDNTGIDIYVNDFYSFEMLYANKSMAAPYGGFSSFLGRKCWDVLYPGQNSPCAYCPREKLIDDNGNPTQIYSWDYQRPFDGAWFRVFSAAFRWVDGRLAQVVSSANITENKRNEALIQHLANYDPLTSLPNRRKLVSDLEVRLRDTAGEERLFLLFFDLDGFKAINDELGHDAGDEFLKQLGAFLSELPLLKDAVYRHGGDEFVAVLSDGVCRTEIQNLVGVIQARLSEPWLLYNGVVSCGASVGVACYPEDGNTPKGLLHKADQAMYQIKRNGGNGVCFSCTPRE